MMAPPDCIFMRRGGKKQAFKEYTGTYTTQEVTGTDGKLYTLYTLTSSGTLTLGDDAQFWMCGGGAGGFYSADKGAWSSVKSTWKSGGGGGGGYFETGKLKQGEFVVTIGTGGGTSSRGATTTITSNGMEVAAATGGLAGSTSTGGNGASGGGAGGYFVDDSGSRHGSFGTSGGLSTYPFGIATLYAHCPGGGGGSIVVLSEDTSVTVGGAGGSNGAKVSTYNSNGGARGGGNGTKFSDATKTGTITKATAGSFYGAGGGGDGFRYSAASGVTYYNKGAVGYQGVLYLLIPAA